MYSLWNCSQVNALKTYVWEVNIGSGNGLVPLAEPMLIQIYVATWYQ